MTFDEIKEAVRAGKTVHWKQSNYKVGLDHKFYVICTNNNDMTGLYWTDGVTTSYDAQDFYLG